MVGFFKTRKGEDNTSFTKGYLTGQILVSSPFMADSRFYQAVIYVCGHDQNGAMGFILNKPLPSIMFSDLLDQLGIDHPEIKANLPIFYGGPVEVVRGFVLHGNDYTQDATVRVNDDFSITATLEVLKQISTREGPKNSILLLGYTGWSQGQLEQELNENQWILLKGSKEFVFEKPIEQMWSTAYQALGIDPHLISIESGHA